MSGESRLRAQEADVRALRVKVRATVREIDEWVAAIRRLLDEEEGRSATN